MEVVAPVLVTVEPPRTAKVAAAPSGYITPASTAPPSPPSGPAPELDEEDAETEPPVLPDADADDDDAVVVPLLPTEIALPLPPPAPLLLRDDVETLVESPLPPAPV